MKKYWPLAIIATSAFIFFILRLGRDLLWDWDECLYGQYAVEMVRTNHFLTNIWNGYIDLQKPPLYSWILTLVGNVNHSEFALRLISVIGAIGLLKLVYLFAENKYSRRIAILSSLVLLTGEVFVIYAMKLSTDILFSLFIFSAFWVWWNTKDKKDWSIVWSGVLFGIAVMIKGLGSLQFMAALGAATILFPSKTRFQNLVKMGIAFAAVILPWHAVAYLGYGDHFIKVYIFDNILKRSKYPIEFHRERIWFYFVLLYRELKPWLFASVLFPIAFIVSSFKKKKSTSLFTSLYKELKKNELIVTILILFILPLISITRVQTRIAWYALPLYPFIALYLGYNLNLIIQFVEKKNKTMGKVIYFLLVILLSLDALRLFNSEVKPQQLKRIIEPRYETILQAQKQPEKEMYYLVAFGERQAKELLPPTEQIDMTWVYGGNPCAVYYSKKHVNYFYTIKDFEQALKTKKGLFMIQNGDLKYAENKQKIFNNNDYTLFRQ